ncbi:MAG TPA: extracellular solute-binding protein [Thermomicrobiales bacterium]|nr:extracellular solute-binding protein [Thermomicrobiales bacterium]
MSKDRSAQLIAEAKAMKYSRRTVMKRASAMGVSASALGGVLSATGHTVSAAPNRAPAFLQGGSLNFLISTAFVPAAEPFFQQQAQSWGEENGVEVTVDFINWPDLQPRITSAVQAGAGPDIVELWPTIPYLFAENLVEVNDLAAAIDQQHGGFYDWVTNTVAVNGEWRSLPHGTSSIAVAYRKSLFEQAGVEDPENNFPDTWEAFFEVGRRLKQDVGVPLGQSLGQSLGDPPGFTYPYMWSFGSMEVEEDRTTVAFDTELFREGLEMFVQAWTDAFDETGLGWDDSTNNSAYLSGQIAATLNGSSIYLAATDEEGENYNPELAEDTFHAPLPAGPAGQFAELGSRSMGILGYSPNQEAAKAFLEWWFSPEPFQAWLEVYEGYIIPPGTTFVDLPVFTEDPKLAPFLEIVEIGRNKGYAGPANLEAAQAASQYVVVNTFAQAVQTGDVGAAIEQGARHLERIYGR